MRKVLLGLLVLALAAPSFADVIITAEDKGDGLLELSYECTDSEVLRGVALTLETTDGDAAIADTDAATVVAVWEDAGKTYGFNTYVDYAFTVEGATPGSYAIAAGHPLAKTGEAGALATFPSSAFSISMGALDDRGSLEGVTGSGVLMTIQFDLTADSTVTIGLDMLRGGIVGEGVDVIEVPGAVALAAAGPACKGDFDGSNTVTSTDITLLLNYWIANKNFLNIAPLNGSGWVDGMDISGDGSVTSTDITLLLNHWIATKNFLNIAPCMP